MARLVSRYSLTALLAIVAGALYAPQPALAASYSNMGTTCLNVDTLQIVAMSFCTSGGGTPTANTSGAVMATTSAGNVVVTDSISGKKTTEHSWEGSGTSGSGSDPNGDSASGSDIPATSGSLAIMGIGGDVAYSRTRFSAGNVSSEGERRARNVGVDLRYAQDFGDWGYNVVVPVRQEVNNASYSAFDNTSIGLAVALVYHLFMEQVHAVSLDIGAVLGVQHNWYDNKHALTSQNGSFALPSFDNPSSHQFGGFFKLGKRVLPGTRLSLSAAYVDNRNLQNRETFGGGTSVTTVDLGINHQISGTPINVYGDLKSIHIDQYSLDATQNYNEANLGLVLPLSPRSGLALKFNRTFNNNSWATTGGLLSFMWALN